MRSSPRANVTAFHGCMQRKPHSVKSPVISVVTDTMYKVVEEVSIITCHFANPHTPAERWCNENFNLVKEK